MVPFRSFSGFPRFLVNILDLQTKVNSIAKSSFLPELSYDSAHSVDMLCGDIKFSVPELFLIVKKNLGAKKTDNILAQGNTRFCYNPQLKKKAKILITFIQKPQEKNTVDVQRYVARHICLHPSCDVWIHLHFKAIFLNPSTHPLGGYHECIPL